MMMRGDSGGTCWEDSREQCRGIQRQHQISDVGVTNSRACHLSFQKLCENYSASMLRDWADLLATLPTNNCNYNETEPQASVLKEKHQPLQHHVPAHNIMRSPTAPCANLLYFNMCKTKFRKYKIHNNDPNINMNATGEPKVEQTICLLYEGLVAVAATLTQYRPELSQTDTM